MSETCLKKSFWTLLVVRFYCNISSSFLPPMLIDWLIDWLISSSVDSSLWNAFGCMMLVLMVCVLLNSTRATVIDACIIHINKEELKTVVCELLACTQPNRHETSTALWNPYRRVSLRGRRAQIRTQRITSKQPFAILVLRRKYGLPCTPKEGFSTS